jgi:molecular chaperone Hsp33
VAEQLPRISGELRRFILDQSPVRGFWVQLGEAWGALRRYQQHTPAVEMLLGEAATAAVLLAATLKFQGTLTLQLTGDGLVQLLVAQCTHDFRLRAIARTEAAAASNADFRALVGHGRLTVTIEAEERGARYQGIVALEGRNFAECLQNYFANSEQLPTQLSLSVDGAHAAGVLVQKLPAASASGEAGAAIAQRTWEDLQSGLAAIDAGLLRIGTAEHVLQRVCGEHDCRLFAPKPVQFQCRCTEGRVAAILRSLGQDEMRSVLAEQGAVTVTCEFCGRPYRFDAVDIERLFAEGPSPEAPKSVN